MSLLTNDEEESVKRGLYVLNIIISTGTVELKISTDGQSFSSVTDGLFSASVQKQIQLPDCKIKAILTGDAVATINETIIAKG